MDGYGRLGRRIEECFISPAAFLAYSYLPCILHHTLLIAHIKKHGARIPVQRHTHTLNSTLHMFFNMERLLREREMAFVKQLFWEVHFCNASMHCSLAATLFYLWNGLGVYTREGYLRDEQKGPVPCRVSCVVRWKERKRCYSSAISYAIYITWYVYARLSFLLQNARDMIMTLAI